MVKEEKLKESDVDFSFLSNDKRFENLTGLVFGDLTVLGPYKREGKTLKWVVKCSCGSVVKTSRTKLKQRGKVCCVDCSEKKLRVKHFTPLEQKETDLLSARDDLQIVKILGDTWADEWEVYCKNCKDTYKRRYRDLIKGVKGCSCCNVSRKGLDEKQVIVDEYCNKFGFTFEGFEGSPIKVKLFCSKHNTAMSTLYHNLEKGKLSCKGCRSEHYTPYNFGSLESFIERSEKVHGKGKFDYSGVDYKGVGKKVSIKCNECGTTNKQTPAGHLTGRGCKSCAKTGFKPDIPYWFYVIKLTGLCEEWYKVGITCDLPRRLYNLSNKSWYELEYVQVKRFDKGWKAFKMEQQILSSLTTKGTIDKKYQPEGHTEVFKPEELPMVEEIIEEMYLEENYIK